MHDRIAETPTLSTSVLEMLQDESTNAVANCVVNTMVVIAVDYQVARDMNKVSFLNDSLFPHKSDRIAYIPLFPRGRF